MHHNHILFIRVALQLTSFLEWWHLRMGKGRASDKSRQARAQDRRQHLRLLVAKDDLGVLWVSLRTLAWREVLRVIVEPWAKNRWRRTIPFIGSMTHCDGPIKKVNIIFFTSFHVLPCRLSSFITFPMENRHFQPLTSVEEE